MFQLPQHCGWQNATMGADLSRLVKVVIRSSRRCTRASGKSLLPASGNQTAPGTDLEDGIQTFEAGRPLGLGSDGRTSTKRGFSGNSLAKAATAMTGAPVSVGGVSPCMAPVQSPGGSGI